MADLSVLKRAVPGEGVAIEETEQYLVKTASDTLDGTDAGYLILVSAGSGTITITLPAVSTTYAGCVYRIVNASEDNTITMVIDANGSETIIGIVATATVTLTNTKATSKKGDRIELVGATATGWHISRQVGTWAQT